MVQRAVLTGRASAPRCRNGWRYGDVSSVRFPVACRRGQRIHHVRTTQNAPVARQGTVKNTPRAFAPSPHVAVAGVFRHCRGKRLVSISPEVVSLTTPPAGEFTKMGGHLALWSPAGDHGQTTQL